MLELALVNFSLYKWWDSRSYFERLNLKGPKPLPLLGNMMGIRKHGLHKNDENILNEFGKTSGYFEGPTPIILTKDAGLIKAVTVKEFSSFTNRRVSIWSKLTWTTFPSTVALPLLLAILHSEAG